MRIFIFILLFLPLLINAQETPQQLFQSASVSWNSFGKQFREDSVLSFKSGKGYFPSLIHNLGFQASFPLRMKEKEFFLFGSVSVITMALITYDQEIDKTFKPIKEDNPFVNTVSPELTELGDYYGYILLAGYGCYSIAFHKYRAFRTSLLASQAAITAGLWIRLGKILSCRMRPGATYYDSEYNSDHWFGPFAVFNPTYNTNRSVAAFDAFPSGHTGAAFAMATVIAEEYKDQKAIPITMYSLASLVGVSRLIEHEHWASDVFLGAVIGYLCGKQVVKNDQRLFPQYKIAQKKVRTEFFPVNYAGATGLGWKMVF